MSACTGGGVPSNKPTSHIQQQTPHQQKVARRACQPRKQGGCCNNCQGAWSTVCHQRICQVSRHTHAHAGTESAVGLQSHAHATCPAGAACFVYATLPRHGPIKLLALSHVCPVDWTSHTACVLGLSGNSNRTHSTSSGGAARAGRRAVNRLESWQGRPPIPQNSTKPAAHASGAQMCTIWSSHTPTPGCEPSPPRCIHLHHQTRCKAGPLGWAAPLPLPLKPHSHSPADPDNATQPSAQTSRAYRPSVQSRKWASCGFLPDMAINTTP